MRRNSSSERDRAAAPVETSATATLQPVEVPPVPHGTRAGFEPEFIRLPPVKVRCPWSGLSRSGLNSVVLATKENDFNPPVKSYCLRQRGSKTGVRLISWPSLRAYILAHEDRAPEGGQA